MNKLPVEDAGTLGVRRKQPNHKCDFQLEIKGKPERNGKAGIKLRSEIEKKLTVQRVVQRRQAKREGENDREIRINMTRPAVEGVTHSTAGKYLSEVSF